MWDAKESYLCETFKVDNKDVKGELHIWLDVIKVKDLMGVDIFIQKVQGYIITDQHLDTTVDIEFLDTWNEWRFVANIETNKTEDDVYQIYWSER